MWDEKALVPLVRGLQSKLKHEQIGAFRRVRTSTVRLDGLMGLWKGHG